jgi:hypothetical protein
MVPITGEEQQTVNKEANIIELDKQRERRKNKDIIKAEIQCVRKVTVHLGYGT